jgi:predicted GH43/DUF377 family glycosyl hydrolase
MLRRLLRICGVLFATLFSPERSTASDTRAGWVKYKHNPVLGGEYGTCFDISVLHDRGLYRMWVSWRPQKSIALVESGNGFHFSKTPEIVLGPADTGWENEVNRPVVIKREDGYHMWYTGQTADRSAIGYATSRDGVTWKRMNAQPVLKPEAPWEKVAVMCPDVMWDDDAKLYRMWYSGGEQYEPNEIGYATSPDGLTWTKSDENPIFSGDPDIPWEKERATACHVVKHDGWFYMFYIGFRDVDHAQIGVARSRDGISHWDRLPQNPIVRSGTGKWDDDACYKPYALFDGQQWILWYNGRRQSLEQIGVVTHAGADLGFGHARDPFAAQSSKHPPRE